MGSESEPVHSMSPLTISDVVKKLLTTFFSANVPYMRGLDIYGSIHVRSDDNDVVCCVLNEHCFVPEKPANVESKDSGLMVPDAGASQQLNTPSGEFVPEWMGQSGGRKQSGEKKLPEQSKGDESQNDAELPTKQKQQPGLSRKLSKLNKTSSGSAAYTAAQSVFPEPLSFGNRSGGAKAEGEKFQSESSPMVRRLFSEENADENAESRNKTDDQSSADDPNIDLAMAATSIIESPQKSGGYDNTGDSEMADLDSSDSHDLERDEKSGSFAFGSSQSFNHSSGFPGFVMPPISFNESEMFSQSSWLPSDGNSRSGNQAGGSDSTFEGSGKSSGLTTEKICMYCLKIFHTNREMSQHIQQQHNSGFPLLDNSDERPYRPRYQNTYAYGGSEMDVDRQLTCSVCSLSFRSLDGLRCHENSKHSRNKLYKCQFCTQSFLTRQAAYTHRMKFHRLIPRKPHLLAGPMTPI